jgi:hypothetical protein
LAGRLVSRVVALKKYKLGWSVAWKKNKDIKNFLAKLLRELGWSLDDSLNSPSEYHVFIFGLAT